MSSSPVGRRAWGGVDRRSRRSVTGLVVTVMKVGDGTGGGGGGGYVLRLAGKQQRPHGKGEHDDRRDCGNWACTMYRILRFQVSSR